MVAALAAAGLLTAGVTVASPAPASAEPGAVVISQVYGGGGNSGAPYTNDYVELFNRGAAAISLDGWSLQYTSATGTGQFGSQKQDLSGSLAPGQYHLVQLSAGSTPSGALPSADTVGTLSLSATAGKVALVRSTTGLACNGGSSPCTPEQTAQIADLVGYGTANYFEGTAAAPGLSNSTAAVIRELGIDVLVAGSDQPYAESAWPDPGDPAQRAIDHAVRVANPGRLLSRKESHQ